MNNAIQMFVDSKIWLKIYWKNPEKMSLCFHKNIEEEENNLYLYFCKIWINLNVKLNYTYYKNANNKGPAFYFFLFYLHFYNV